MKKNYWLHKWQQGHIAFHKEEVNAELIAHVAQLRLQPGDGILVPLCGKSKDLLWLAEKGYHVIGVELSSIACNDFFSEAKITPQITHTPQFIKYQYKQLEIWCGDFFALSPVDLPPIHAAYDCKALIALPPDMRKDYVNHLLHCAGRDSRFLLLSIESPDQVTGPPFPVNQAEINALYNSDFVIQQVKKEKVNNISEHLIQKGYKEMTDTTYLISR